MKPDSFDDAVEEIVTLQARLQAAEAGLKEERELRVVKSALLDSAEKEVDELNATLRRVAQALIMTGERTYADGSVCWCPETRSSKHAPHCRIAQAALADPVVRRVREAPCLTSPRSGRSSSRPAQQPVSAPSAGMSEQFLPSSPL